MKRDDRQGERRERRQIVEMTDEWNARHANDMAAMGIDRSPLFSLVFSIRVRI